MDGRLQSENPKVLEALKRNQRGIPVAQTDESLLVTGATGRQGGSVIRSARLLRPYGASQASASSSEEK